MKGIACIKVLYKETEWPKVFGDIEILLMNWTKSTPTREQHYTKAALWGSLCGDSGRTSAECPGGEKSLQTAGQLLPLKQRLEEGG